MLSTKINRAVVIPVIRRHRPHRIRGVVLLIFSLAIPPASAAELYKTIDSKGHPVYSDHPLTSASQKIAVQVKQPSTDDAARVANEQADSAAEALRRERQRQLDQQEKAQQELAQQKRDQYCNAARNHYQLFADGGLIYRRDAEGKRVFYSAQEIEEQRTEAKANLDKYCNE